MSKQLCANTRNWVKLFQRKMKFKKFKLNIKINWLYAAASNANECPEIRADILRTLYVQTKLHWIKSSSRKKLPRKKTKTQRETGNCTRLLQFMHLRLGGSFMRPRMIFSFRSSSFLVAISESKWNPRRSRRKGRRNRRGLGMCSTLVSSSVSPSFSLFLPRERL